MVTSKLTRGIVFDIQGFSVHDGPGCRTLIFFKGCTLSCVWCSNPEGISPFREPIYHHTKCISDGLCLMDCPHAAITEVGDHPDVPLSFNRNKCAGCATFDCAQACCTNAINICGYEISCGDLLTRIQRDRPYWGEGGGITLTGGEPFSQPGFAHDVLKNCYDSYIHTAVETCGNVPWDNIAPSLPWIDWMFFDIKHMEDNKHREATGHGNKKILENARLIARKSEMKVIFRMPVIPGFNDSAKNIRETAEFIHETGRDTINILPVHHMGREKYKAIGKPYFTSNFKSPDTEALASVKSLFESQNIRCFVGSDTPF